MKLRVFNKQDEERFRRSMARDADVQVSVRQVLRRLDRKPDRFMEQLIMIVIGIVSAVIVITIAASSGFFKSTSRMGVVILVVATMIPVGVAQAYYRSRFNHRWDNTYCKKCGYSLDAIPSDRTVVVNGTPRKLGPSTCPECGQSWPLIFPQ